MSEHTPILPFRVVHSGGVGLNIEDAEHGSVCFGFGNRPHNAHYLVKAANAHAGLVEACKAALARIESDCEVHDQWSESTTAEGDQLRAALAAVGE